TGPDARYVGSATCAACHDGRHQSYLHTNHSRALSDIDPGHEPPDGEFAHAKSGRVYRVYRKGGELRHAEAVQTEAGDEIAKTDVPVRYLVGSGNFARTYLVEIDGFLFESPITWYASRKRWDLSPGYDSANHFGFERPVNEGCLACHTGRVEPVGGSVHR